jgi:cysteinyl-tRNA synthetase
MNVLLFNTMSRSKELFRPDHSGPVKVYTCGPTVYNYAHVGNMRAYLFADTLVRTLRLVGYDVRHVMNITDVGHLVSDADEGEDKMALGAAREGLTAWEIAEKYTSAFFEHSRMLNILRPDIVSKATDHIRQQIEMISDLEKQGYTYSTSDGIYFDTSLVTDYGRLARLDVAGLKAGARVDVSEKRNKTDFALWKYAKPGERRQMEWSSPWGVGFPGWHIECSAMAIHYLGPMIDIHTGGIDHIPIHHTNEIAQSETATGVRPFVKYWMHSEFLELVDEERMAKSRGNIVTIETLKNEGFDPLAFRFLCLKAHYRSRLRFSRDILRSAEAGYRRLKDSVLSLQAAATAGPRPDVERYEKYSDAIAGALYDDLSTPVALVWLQRTIEDDHLSAADRLSIVDRFDLIFGLGLSNRTTKEEDAGLRAQALALLDQRRLARRDKQWSRADELRRGIEQLGYAVQDTGEDSKIRKV